jgi:hypothetical protein
MEGKLLSCPAPIMTGTYWNIQWGVGGHYYFAFENNPRKSLYLVQVHQINETLGISCNLLQATHIMLHLTLQPLQMQSFQKFYYHT